MDSMRLRTICLAAVATMLSILPANACLNDQDTLAREARARPEALNAITGRFERNPPLYYQMRITRESAQIAVNPNDLDKYDDVAVAYDRLGDDDSAIAWIEKKRKHLPPYNAKDAVLKEQWYRYYANVGTFWMHRWAHLGADMEKKGDVKVASAFIEKAIAIKPNAHFGREKYQLLIMKWVLNAKSETLPQALAGSPPTEASTALSGLIELGGAWQSFDVYYALSEILHGDEEKTHALGTLAALRAYEIYKAGGRSLHPELIEEGTAESLQQGGYFIGDGMQDQYDRLRKEADDWETNRTAYMMARLTKGDHPDADPNFWADYHPSPMPEIVSPRELRGRHAVAVQNFLLASLLVVIVACGALIYYRRKGRH